MKIRSSFCQDLSCEIWSVRRTWPHPQQCKANPGSNVYGLMVVFGACATKFALSNPVLPSRFVKGKMQLLPSYPWRIHGTGIFTNTWFMFIHFSWYIVHIGKCTSPMDPSWVLYGWVGLEVLLPGVIVQTQTSCTCFFSGKSLKNLSHRF